MHGLFDSNVSKVYRFSVKYFALRYLSIISLYLLSGIECFARG